MNTEFVRKDDHLIVVDIKTENDIELLDDIIDEKKKEAIRLSKIMGLVAGGIILLAQLFNDGIKKSVTYTMGSFLGYRICKDIRPLVKTIKMCNNRKKEIKDEEEFMHIK